MKQENKLYWKLWRNGVIAYVLVFTLLGSFCLHWTPFEVLLGFVLCTAVSSIVLGFYVLYKKKVKRSNNKQHIAENK